MQEEASIVSSNVYNSLQRNLYRGPEIGFSYGGSLFAVLQERKASMTRLRPMPRWWIVGFSMALLAAGPVGRAVAQTQHGIGKVRDAFAQGDARALLGDASDRIEIALLGRSRLYSRAQAFYVMQDFFRRYPPEGFTLQSQAQEQGSWFATGRYRYKHAEQPLLVYLRLRLKSDQWELREMRIEERQRE